MKVPQVPVQEQVQVLQVWVQVQAPKEQVLQASVPVQERVRASVPVQEQVQASVLQAWVQMPLLTVMNQ